MDARHLADLAESILSRKAPLNSLWQEIAEQFFPERADFTLRRSMGTDFAANIMSSYPVMCRRDMGNQIGTMLRPTAKPWFHAARKHADMEGEQNIVKRYLQHFDETMRRAMYDRSSMFKKAAKEGDHDFATFGQCALSVELNRNGDGLLYRAWHLRDMAWQENADGELGFIVRKWKPTVQVASDTFGKDKLDDKMQRTLDTDPFSEVEFIHIVCDAEMYDKKGSKPRWSIWWDCANQKVIEEKNIKNRHYRIPRWNTVSSTVWGTQYAYSPAVVAALPDARLIQAMTFTLLEAGEKATNPPMVATVDAVKSDVAVYAGGITWVDNEYDERLGEALRPITQDFRGFNFGVQMAADTRQMIHKAFFLDTLTLPAQTKEMTAYEVGQRVQEYIRNALPLFEPMEDEYNSAICEETFEIMLSAGAFGSPLSWPREMAGMEIEFRFESPLHDVIEQQKGQKWMEAKSIMADAMALDPTAGFVMDSRFALRDALNAIGVPARWLNTEEQVEEQAQAQAQKQQASEMLAAMQQGSEAAANLAGAQKDMAAAQTAGQSVQTREYA